MKARSDIVRDLKAKVALFADFGDERFDGTPFTDRGFQHVPALRHLDTWLAELMAAA